MTSTLSPHDTGDIVGEGTRNLAPFVIQRPALRRSDATGEFPQYAPATIADVDQPEPGTKTVDLASRLVGQPYAGRHRRSPRVDWLALARIGAIWILGTAAGLVMMGLLG